MVFGKKSEPGPPAVVTLLTPEALITGTTAIEASRITVPVAEGTQGSWDTLDLQDASLQPLRPGTPAEALGSFAARGVGIVAAVLPDGPTIDDTLAWKAYANEVPGTFHLGPFRLRGTLRLLHPEVVDLLMPMVDVEVSSASPDLVLPPLRAPLALVNTRWLTGYQPA